MDTVAGIYLTKLNEVQSVLDSCASRAGLAAPQFSGLLSGAVASQCGVDQISGDKAFDTIINQAAADHGLEANLVKAVIQVESSFHPDAVSGAGAEGLMQLMPSTAASLGVKDSFDPVQNICAGTEYLAKLLDRFGDLRLALAAYNTGPSRVARLNITDPDNASDYSKLSERVRGYVSKVLSCYETYSAL